MDRTLWNTRPVRFTGDRAFKASFGGLLIRKGAFRSCDSAIAPPSWQGVLQSRPLALARFEFFLGLWLQSSVRRRSAWFAAASYLPWFAVIPFAEGLFGGSSRARLAQFRVGPSSAIGVCGPTLAAFVGRAPPRGEALMKRG